MKLLTEVAQETSLAEDIKQAATEININKSSVSFTVSRGKMSGKLARALMDEAMQFKEQPDYKPEIIVEWNRYGYQVFVNNVSSEQEAIAKLTRELRSGGVVESKVGEINAIRRRFADEPDTTPVEQQEQGRKQSKWSTIAGIVHDLEQSGRDVMDVGRKKAADGTVYHEFMIDGEPYAIVDVTNLG